MEIAKPKKPPMAKPKEDSKTSARVHPSNDSDVVPSSYSLEKFRLFETRAVMFSSEHRFSSSPSLRARCLESFRSDFAEVLSDWERLLQEILQGVEDRPLWAVRSQPQWRPGCVLVARDKEPASTDQRGKSRHRRSDLSYQGLWNRRSVFLGHEFGYLLECFISLMVESETFFFLLAVLRLYQVSGIVLPDFGDQASTNRMYLWPCDLQYRRESIDSNSAYLYSIRCCSF